MNEVKKLTPEETVEAREGALELATRGYTYGTTPPAEVRE